MHILIAVDSFKGSLSSKQIGNILSKNLSPIHKCQVVPISDGGEGLIDALKDSLELTVKRKQVTGPDGSKVSARYGVNDKQRLMVLEMAEASGLILLKPQQRSAARTTTRGCGELLALAQKLKAKKIIMGIGGSATNDGGCGALSALGFHITPPAVCGRELAAVQDISPPPSLYLQKTDLRIACDVTSPITGKKGATMTYGPQKGATAKELTQLEKGMRHWKNIIRRKTGIELNHVPGSGAAGGIGGALHAFCGGRMIPGIKLIFEELDLVKKIRQADLVISGEGRFDEQSLRGKVVSGVLDLAIKYNKPLVLLAGSSSLSASRMKKLGITSSFLLTDDASLKECLTEPEKALRQTACRLADSLKSGDIL